MFQKLVDGIHLVKNNPIQLKKHQQDWTGLDFFHISVGCAGILKIHHIVFGPADAGPRRWQCCCVQKPRFVLPLCISLTGFVTLDKSLL